MSVVDAPVAADQPRGKLRRELRLFEALAISVGIMAPTAAMALNGVAPAGLVGRAVPLAFLFASIAIALVSYAFIRLTSYFNHAGSAYALVGVTIGPRAGFFACWALLATYSCFLAANFAEIGLFGETFFSGIGIWDDPDWIIISLVAAAFLWSFAFNDIRAVTRGLLSLEFISVTLVAILIVVIYVKVSAAARRAVRISRSSRSSRRAERRSGRSLCVHVRPPFFRRLRRRCGARRGDEQPTAQRAARNCGRRRLLRRLLHPRHAGPVARLRAR